MEKLKQMFLDNEIAVKCENQEEVNAIYEWICENVDKKYQRAGRLPYLGGNDDFPKYIFCSHKYGMVCEFNFDYDLDKQVIFRNGEFKLKNNFKDYGFEADFEGEILKEVDSCYIGYIITNQNINPCRWKQNGEIYTFSYIYNLKPIKKEWYENPESRFKLVMYRDGLYTLSWWYKDTSNVDLIDIKKATTQTVNVKDVRPATKEEVLSLLVEK